VPGAALRRQPADSAGERRRRSSAGGLLSQGDRPPDLAAGIVLRVDVHVRRAVTTGLRLRGVDVLTAREDNAGELDDSRLLDRATKLERVLFTQDDDLLREAARRQQTGERFTGVIYGHQLNIMISQCIDDLELIAQATESDSWENQVVYLPLK